MPNGGKGRAATRKKDVAKSKASAAKKKSAAAKKKSDAHKANLRGATAHMKRYGKKKN